MKEARILKKEVFHGHKDCDNGQIRQTGGRKAGTTGGKEIRRPRGKTGKQRKNRGGRTGGKDTCRAFDKNTQSGKNGPGNEGGGRRNQGGGKKNRRQNRQTEGHYSFRFFGTKKTPDQFSETGNVRQTGRPDRSNAENQPKKTLKFSSGNADTINGPVCFRKKNVRGVLSGNVHGHIRARMPGLTFSRRMR